MSEPMTTHEIEDVLSSIRRLVSDDYRPAAAGAGQPPSDKLLLTPALRVVTDRDTDAPATRAGDVMAQLGSAVVDDDWEPPLGDAEDWPPGDWDTPTDTAETPDRAVFVHRGLTAAEGQIDAPAAAFSAAADDTLAGHAALHPTWVDRAEAEVIADLAQRVQDDLAQNLTADAPLFDEGVLRDLVRDLIREELAGALGERITRNVRKLVRAEIARAMAVQSIE